MADIYPLPNVTVFGANGTVALTGIASADMISIAFSDEATLVEQTNGINKVTGFVLHNQRDEISLTFYPIPVKAGADYAASDYQAITLPDPLATVTLTSGSPSSATSPDKLPTLVATKSFTYIGGGTMNLTANGLMTMTLPCRKWALLTPA
jgi:hypothetical protein